MNQAFYINFDTFSLDIVSVLEIVKLKSFPDAAAAMSDLSGDRITAAGIRLQEPAAPQTPIGGGERFSRCRLRRGRHRIRRV